MTKTPIRLPTTIRPATIQDVAGISEVHVACWRETYSGIVPQDFLDKLDPKRRAMMWTEVLSQVPSCVYVAATDAGRIVGFASGGKNRTPEHPYDGELFAIYLLQAFQGSGAGRRLFDSVVQTLADQGHKSMMCWVLTGNPTLGFYQSRGGVECGRAQFDLDGRSLEEIGLGWRELKVMPGQ